MEVVHARCCGLDVHKKSVIACVLITQPDGNTERYIRTFKTMTTDLVALSDWLSTLSVSHVALESTGVYWRPVYNVLEHEQRTLLLVNPQHMRAVPGKRPTSRMRNGWPICCATACSEPVSSRRSRFASCGR
jgi:transposase